MAQLVPVPVFINSHVYEWSDIQFSIAGSTPIVGVNEINYSTSRAGKNVMGSGSDVIGFGFGSKEYTADISMLMDEAQGIIALAPNRDITLIEPFTCTIAWLDSDNALVVNKMLNCRFLNYEVKTKQGDTSTYLKFNMIYAGLVV